MIATDLDLTRATLEQALADTRARTDALIQELAAVDRQLAERDRDRRAAELDRWQAARASYEAGQAADATSRAARLRQQVLDHFGAVCACCGCTWDLEVDHVRGDGKQHRAEVGDVIKWLVENDFPAEPPTQILCGRCNCSKGQGSQCTLDHSGGPAEPPCWNCSGGFLWLPAIGRMGRCPICRGTGYLKVPQMAV